ncbi:hypothetical protein N7452_004790 [Penicillium brevicompactum]|uniref:Uncharacterized protein n=1 Tax=Penicillium brevicompactum TaxID=5074 RepID=A0A9W9UEJ1_PENBR|nr:hypothetical protein N7452_004790 [Penicillium brevicompactum]
MPSNSDTNTTAIFKCSYSGCNASYQRKEHLRRHQIKHSQQQVFPCSNCDREFARRSDTLRRHVWQHHGIKKPSARAQRACESCRATKSRCQGDQPCSECLRRGIECSFKDQRDEEKEASAPLDPTLLSEKRDHYISLYFEKFHARWPFIHRGSFEASREAPLLIQSMVVLGMWTSGEETVRKAAVDLHNNLDLAIRQQKHKWDASEVEEACSDCKWPIPTYQAILLHIIFSIMHASGGTLDLDLRFSLPPNRLELLMGLVRSCRKLGMFHYPNILERYREVDVFTYVWVCIEEVKRFDLALYKVCGKLTGLGSGGNLDEGASSLFSAEELQFPMPNNCSLWHAVGRDQWISALEGKLVDLDDLAQDSWISNSAGLLNFLCGV